VTGTNLLRLSPRAMYRYERRQGEPSDQRHHWSSLDRGWRRTSDRRRRDDAWQGKMSVSGNLRDSATASYARSRAIDFGIEPRLFDHRDIHVHVPEGAPLCKKHRSPTQEPYASPTSTFAAL
jgi:Lon protease (S16) C-terminal proteolytic domain